MIVPGPQQLANPGPLIGAALPTASRAPASKPPPFGMTMWFSVVVPSLDSGEPKSLGAWSACSGLAVELSPDGPFEEGGNYTTPHYLPGRVTYPKVTLQRAMTPGGTAKVRRWLEDLTAEWSSGEPARFGTRSPVVITLYSGIGPAAVKVHTWELRDAIPVSWAVPQLSTSGAGGFALESLALQHSGFLKPVDGPAGSELVLTDPAGQRLSFQYNPAKITLSKAREAATGRKKVTSGDDVIDANSLSITLAELRIDGYREVARAAGLLREWLEFEGWRDGRLPVAAKPGNKPLCEKCGKTEVTSTDAAPGVPKDLRVTWGRYGGGMPQRMVLKKFDLTLTRFTMDGRPSRATAQLTLQEYTGAARRGSGATPGIGGHRSGPVAAGAAGSHPEDRLRNPGGGR